MGYSINYDQVLPYLPYLLGGAWLFLPVGIAFLKYEARYVDGGMGAKYVLAAVGAAFLVESWKRGRRATAQDPLRSADALSSS